MYRAIIKPSLDCIWCLITLPFILPVILIISLLIAIFDGRPIFFIQQRPGRNEELFYLIKFRTMNTSSRKHAVSDITRLGRILRETSLDELPSIINILKGDMSFIGPRPLLVEYLDRYSDDQKVRHQVRPGLTGLAQINGRNSITWKKRLGYDKFYIENISIWLDIKIFFRTILIVINRKGINADKSKIMTEFINKHER